MLIHKLACVADISYSLARTVLREDLGLKSYIIQSVQKLLPVDYAKRVNFPECYLLQSAEVQENMFFSDEAYFYLKLPINKQNNRISAQENPQSR